MKRMMFAQKVAQTKIATTLKVSKTTVVKWAKMWREDREHEERNKQMGITEPEY